MIRLLEWLSRRRRRRFYQTAAELDDLGWTDLAAEVRRQRHLNKGMARWHAPQS
jgi:hypothetical protein